MCVIYNTITVYDAIVFQLPENAGSASAQNFTDNTNYTMNYAVYFQFIIDLEDYLFGLVAILANIKLIPPFLVSSFLNCGVAWSSGRC